MNPRGRERRNSYRPGHPEYERQKRARARNIANAIGIGAAVAFIAAMLGSAVHRGVQVRKLKQEKELQERLDYPKEVAPHIERKKLEELYEKSWQKRKQRMEEMERLRKEMKPQPKPGNPEDRQWRKGIPSKGPRLYARKVPPRRAGRRA